VTSGPISPDVTQALMQITAPQAIPSQYGLDEVEPTGRELVTTIVYPQMLKTVDTTWLNWVIG
jgi:hypothetical protein